MREQLKRALDNVHAEEALKEQTRDFLARKTRGYTVRDGVRPGRLAAAAACILLLLTGAGGWACFTPTSTVSIDVNPSLELNVNRFDRVVSVTGVNHEGQALAETLNLTFLPCTSAVEQVLDSPGLADYLGDDPAVAITVVGDNEVQRDRLLSGVENATAQRQAPTAALWTSARQSRPTPWGSPTENTALIWISVSWAPTCPRRR